MSISGEVMIDPLSLCLRLRGIQEICWINVWIQSAVVFGLMCGIGSIFENEVLGFRGGNRVWRIAR